MRTVRIIAIAPLIVAGAVVLHAAQPRPAEAQRTELQRHDLSLPGREVIQVRVEIGPGSVFPGHTHPGEEIIYVIEGEWEYEISGKPVKANAGDVLFVPAGAIHSAKNVGTGKAVELATYIVEKGRPLLTLVK
jgi:quercetin dioxygenase-like cupin family protein